jgi:hypothetical protein
MEEGRRDIGTILSECCKTGTTNSDTNVTTDT